MDGREVQDVETHLRNFGKKEFAIGECADRAREHFIPRAESRTNRIDCYAEFPVDGGSGSIGIFGSERSELFVDNLRIETLGCGNKLLGVGSKRSFGDVLEQCRTDLQIDGYVLVRFNALLEIVIPG